MIIGYQGRRALDGCKSRDRQAWGRRARGRVHSGWNNHQAVLLERDWWLRENPWGFAFQSRGGYTRSNLSA